MMSRSPFDAVQAPGLPIAWICFVSYMDGETAVGVKARCGGGPLMANESTYSGFGFRVDRTGFPPFFELFVDS